MPDYLKILLILPTITGRCRSPTEKIDHTNVFLRFFCSTRTDREEAQLFRSYRTPWTSITENQPQHQETEIVDDSDRTRDRNMGYTDPPLVVGFDDISIGNACKSQNFDAGVMRRQCNVYHCV